MSLTASPSVSCGESWPDEYPEGMARLFPWPLYLPRLDLMKGLTKAVSGKTTNPAGTTTMANLFFMTIIKR